MKYQFCADANCGERKKAHEKSNKRRKGDGVASLEHI